MTFIITNINSIGGVVHTSRQHDLWDKIFKNGDGEYVLFQMPNVWIIAWAVITMMSLFTTGQVSNVLGWLGLAALTVWAFLEITRGVNYFRRALGAFVALFIIASAIALLQ